MGVGAGTPERALSPSSASDHLGNSRFKPDLQCPASPSGAGFPEPRGQEKAARTEGSGELPAARDPVRQTSLLTEWGQPSLVPQHHSFEGGSGLPGWGCPSSDRRDEASRRLPVPMLHVGVQGVARRPGPAQSCHCWSERERAARDKELSMSSNRRQGQRQGREGVGSVKEGRAAVSQTGSGRGPRNLSLHLPQRGAQGHAVPTRLPSGFLPRPSWGAEALPCPASGHMVEEGQERNTGWLPSRGMRLEPPFFPSRPCWEYCFRRF